MIRQRPIELLAPAKNMECGSAPILLVTEMSIPAVLFLI